MTREELYAQLMNELIDGVDAGDFTDVSVIPSKYVYAHLVALFNYAEQLDGGRDFYTELYTFLCEAGRYKVVNKYQRGEKLKVTFLAISASEWPADDLYRIFEENPGFEVSITNCPLTDRSYDDRKKTWLLNKDFFEQKGYRVLENYEPEKDNIYSWDDLNEKPDIIIHLTCWYESLPNCYRITNYRFDQMNVYIPYGFGAGNSTNEKFAINLCYNKEFHNLMHRYYVSTKLELCQVQKYQLLQGRNAVYSGYMKMDQLCQKRRFTDADIKKIWKIPPEATSDSVRKVIIAPHHSFLGYCGIKFSTFAYNVFFWLYLAEKYKDNVSFIFKPHPNLRYRAVEAKIFESAEDYDQYIAMWNALPNAKVVEEGNYLDAFATSDAMIMDSMSFIAEYMYVNKPLLFLTRKEQRFTELGQKCLGAYYAAAGNDYMKIENFLEKIVIRQEDSMQHLRENVFTDYLDYVSDNECLAYEFIYRDILSSLSVEEV